MSLINLIPQPIKEVVINYKQLKDQLKTQNPSTNAVQVIATKVAMTVIYCFEAIVITSLIMITAHVNPPALLGIVFPIVVGLVKPEGSLGAGSLGTLTVALAVPILIINGTIAAQALPVACVAGALSYGFGRVYSAMLQRKWEQLDSVIDSDVYPHLNSTASAVTGWDIAMHKYEGFIEGIIHHAKK